VQKRLVALHHLDAPWKPAEVEQRDGRILRQGNENPEVAIYRYVTEGSFDAYMWQALETKARFISQVMTGGSTVRRAEDIGGQELSYAEVKAIASGNPALLTLAEADAEIQRSSVLKKNHTDEQFLIRRKLKELPETIERLVSRRQQLGRDQATLLAHASDPLTIAGRVCHPDDQSALLGNALDRLPALVSRTSQFDLGVYRGLGFGIMLHPSSAPEVFLKGAATRCAPLSREHHGRRAVLNALGRLAESYAEQDKTTGRELALARQQLADYQARLGNPFPSDTYLEELTQLRDHLRHALSGRAASSPAPDPGQPPTSSTADLADRIRLLQASHTADEPSERSCDQPMATAEEPVTTRLRRRVASDAIPETPDSAADAQPRCTPVFPHPGATEPPAPADTLVSPAAAGIPAQSGGSHVESARAGFRGQRSHGSRRTERQMSLF
jgi:hypothetical protein